MAAPIAFGSRLRGYAVLSRLLIPSSYLGKIVLLTFIGTHIPLLAIIAYLLAVGPSSAPALAILLVALAATLVGAAAAIIGLWLLLAPVAEASIALHNYRLAGTPPRLPTTLGGEAGQLLTDVQHTLDHLDDFVRRLADEALRDPLTGVANRRAFEQRLGAEMESARRRGDAVALAALDVDGLKDVNDTWGHDAGDACLQRLAAAFVRHVGGHGWVARWGGDEFIAVIRETAGAPRADAILREVEADLAGNPTLLPNGEQVRLRASGGVSRAHPDESPHDLFTRADAALYRSKRTRHLAL